MTMAATRSVLIVDDEPGLRLALRTHFVRHGWETNVASGVREAQTALGLRCFDLVLSDVQLGDGDGFAVLQAVRHGDRARAVLFLTAFGSVPEAVRAVRGGAVDYLTKPVCFEQLLEVALHIVTQGRGHEASERKIAAAPLQAPRQAPGPALVQSSGAAGSSGSPQAQSLDELQRTHLERTLERCDGNRTRAAAQLGISVRTLRNKVRQYDLPPRRYA